MVEVRNEIATFLAFAKLHVFAGLYCCWLSAVESVEADSADCQICSQLAPHNLGKLHKEEIEIAVNIEA